MKKYIFWISLSINIIFLPFAIWHFIASHHYFEELRADSSSFASGNWMLSNNLVFSNSNENKALIFVMSEKNYPDTIIDDWKIQIFSIRHHPDDKEFQGLEHFIATSTRAVLTLGTYHILHGNKKVGLEILKQIKKHHPKYVFGYPYEKDHTIEEIINAAIEFQPGEDPDGNILQKIDSQYIWLKDAYS